MFCSNVSVLCLNVIVTDYVLIGEIAGNKHPVLLLLLFKYLGATLTENGDLDAEMVHTIQSDWGKTGREGILDVLAPHAVKRLAWLLLSLISPTWRTSGGCWVIVTSVHSLYRLPVSIPNHARRSSVTAVAACVRWRFSPACRLHGQP